MSAGPNWVPRKAFPPLGKSLFKRQRSRRHLSQLPLNVSLPLSKLLKNPRFYLQPSLRYQLPIRSPHPSLQQSRQSLLKLSRSNPKCSPLPGLCQRLLLRTSRSLQPHPRPLSSYPFRHPELHPNRRHHQKRPKHCRPPRLSNPLQQLLPASLSRPKQKPRPKSILSKSLQLRSRLVSDSRSSENWERAL